MMTPYGLLTCVSENPGEPLPINVETDAANAGRGIKVRSAAFSRSRRFIWRSLAHRRAFSVEVPQHAGLHFGRLFARNKSGLECLVEPQEPFARVSRVFGKRAVGGDHE